MCGHVQEIFDASALGVEDLSGLVLLPDGTFVVVSQVRCTSSFRCVYVGDQSPICCQLRAIPMSSVLPLRVCHGACLILCACLQTSRVLVHFEKGGTVLGSLPFSGSRYEVGPLTVHKRARA